jgi:hypothetical protein
MPALLSISMSWSNLSRRMQNVEALHNLGFIYEKQAMIGTSKNFYMKALGINLEHQEAHLNLGMIAEQEGI